MAFVQVGIRISSGCAVSFLVTVVSAKWRVFFHRMTIIMLRTEPVKRTALRFARWHAIHLNTPRTLAIARVIVPLCFGLYSLLLGADSNWDLYNYHMYNPFAWLHGRMQTDLAPAGMQSYFNPLLDVPLFWANTHLPSRLVGFLMGATHGLIFILILSIAQRALPALPDEDRYRLPLLLALAGCLTANFLSGLGNSMGDDTTALFVLASVLLLLSRWEQLCQWTTPAVFMSIAGGALVGFGAGLKLTNAIYAVALCAALFAYPGRAIVRLRLSFFFGIGVLLGIGTTGGYWMVHLWKLFGNPLYPQFGAIFPNPLTQAGGMVDVRWLPRGVFETAFWPFIFTANSHRVGETEIRQIVWPIAYVLYWAWFAVAISFTRSKMSPLEPQTRFVLLFVALGYLVWMEFFSVYRYIVAVEVLTPLVVWILLHRLLPYHPAQRAAGWLIGISVVVVVTGGARTWGHERWADPLYYAEVPVIAQPDRTTAVIVSSDRAWAWLATAFPEGVAFTQLAGSFPGTAAFRDRIRQIITMRGGPAYAIVNGDYFGRAAANRAYVEQAIPVFGLIGFTLDAATCIPYRSRIGKGVTVYQWCPLTLR
jgi:hypothetical protein